MLHTAPPGTWQTGTTRLSIHAWHPNMHSATPSDVSLALHSVSQMQSSAHHSLIITHNHSAQLEICSDVRCHLRCQIDDNGATAVRMPHKQQHRQSPPASMQQQEDCKQCTAVVIADIQMCRPAQLALSTLKISTPQNTSSLLGRHVLSHQQQLPSLEPQSKATPAGQPAGAQAVVLSGSIAVRTP